MAKSNNKLNSRQFFQLATWFEGSLVVVAYIIGWFTGIDPWASFHWNWATLVFGLLGTIPLYLLFLTTFGADHGGLRTIRHFLIEQMGAMLSAANVWHLAYLAVLAGVTEEALFRGVLQPLFERQWGWLGGLIISNLFFAMAHAITKLYAVLAGLTGIYLGIALDIGGYRNLGIPIFIHAFYDFLAFLAVAKAYNRQHSREF